jgi:hypothetical protein
VKTLESSNLILEMNIPETGTLVNKELISYKLMIFTKSETKVIIDLLNESGNPDLIVKKCTSDDKDKCTITQTDVNNI